MSEESTFRYEFENRGDYLFIKLAGRLDSRETMLAYQQAMAEAMTPELEHRAVVDSRASERPPMDLRAEMWTWMSESGVLKRIAVVAEQERTKQRVERSGDINRLMIHSFDTVEEAVEWVRRGSTAR